MIRKLAEAWSENVCCAAICRERCILPFVNRPVRQCFKTRASHDQIMQLKRNAIVNTIITCRRIRGSRKYAVGNKRLKYEAEKYWTVAYKNILCFLYSHF